jgi:hypothetical protein
MMGSPIAVHLLGVGGDRDEMLRHEGGIRRVFQKPLARGVRIGHGFQGGEGLGRDDEQRGFRIQVANRLVDVGAVHIGHEMHLEIAALIGAQRVTDQLRTEVRATDADVDHIGDHLAAVAFPGTGTDIQREPPHAFQNIEHRRHDILVADHHPGAAAVAQRRVQHRPVFGVVDGLASEHAVDPFGDTRRLGKVDKPVHRFVGDQVLGKIEMDSGVGNRKAAGAIVILGKQVTHSQLGDLLSVFL